MDHSRCSLPGTVTQAIDNFKTVFSQRVQTLERGGMGKREITSYLLESALSPPPGPGTAELELVRKHGVLDTQSAAQILAIRSELLKLQRQGLDVPTSINEMTKRIRQVEIDTTTRKRKRDPNSDNLEANEAKRTKLSPTERYMERYKKRKAEQDEGPDFVPPAPKRFRFMNYRDPILHVPDPIAFQFQDPFAPPEMKETDTNQTTCQTTSTLLPTHNPLQHAPKQQQPISNQSSTTT